MRLKLSLTLLIFAFTKLAISQNTSIKGKVIDEKTGESLPGAVVMITGTSTGVSTDLDGNFSLMLSEPATCEVQCKLISYNTKIIRDVIIKKGEPTFLTIGLQSASNDLGTVEVTATMAKESNAAMLIMQKNSATVSDGVSSESIKRTPDKNTSDVLKRVSGASIQDNKFAVIRGLNDRYNAAYLNGAPLPSSESDRKAFAFNIFPANMLDNLVIIKTATPDLPGEFAGGIIQINTKNIPDKNFQSAAYSYGYNTITTGKQQVYYQGGKKDWLGVDDGTRNIPAGIPDNGSFPQNIHEQAKLAKQTNVDWALYDKKFSPNYSLQYSMGYTLPIRQKQLGLIMAVTYNKTNSYTESVLRSYTGNGSSNTTASQLDVDYMDKTYSEQILTGVLANVCFKANENNILSFKNLYSINSDDKVISRNGKRDPLESNPTVVRSNARWFTSNTIYSGQLIGEHYLPVPKIRLNWVGAFSEIERKIPNLRRSIYTRLDHVNDPTDPNPGDTMFVANIAPSNVGPDYGGGMFFAENKEKIYSFKGDASYVLTAGKLRTEIKIGGFYQTRSRNFFARQLGYTQYGVAGGNITFQSSLLLLPENEIFNNANMGLISPGVGGFKLTEATKPSDKYTASSKLTAGYLMLDHKFSIVRLVWGVRLENFNQRLNAKKSTNDSVNVNTTLLDVLPSANLILSVTEKQNIRVSWSQTLNRPEYRELAPFAFYDFETQYVVTGNDSLKRAKIQNADLRYEIYPGKGQLLSASLFFKQFKDPIEQISRPDVTNEISYKNVPQAVNYGVELECRIVLATLFKADSSKVLNDITAFSNVAIIRSKVDVSGIIGSEAASRPLQGQSPYVLNAGLQYTNNELGLSFSASYNKVGPRIAIVGNVSEPETWENSRAFLDLQLSKSFWKKRMEIRFNAQNVLSQNQVYYQNRSLTENKSNAINNFFNAIATGDPSDKNGYNKAQDDLIRSTRSGKVFSLGLSLKF